MTNIVRELQSITNDSRVMKEKEIGEALKEVEWESISSSGIESAKKSAMQGRSSVEITITPCQRIGYFNEEPTDDWTEAKAYRNAFDEYARGVFIKMGFSISTRMQPNWHDHTFLYCYTLSWSKNANG